MPTIGCKILLMMFGLSVLFFVPGSVHAATSNTCAPIPRVRVSANPSVQVLTAGATGTSTLTVESLDGFVSIVNLEVVNADPNMRSPIIAPSTVNVANGPQTATLTFTLSNTTGVGTYSLEVNATDANTATDFDVTTVSAVLVAPPVPELGIMASNFLAPVAVNSSTTDMVNLESLHGLADGTVTMSTSVGSVPPTAVLPTVSITPTAQLYLGVGSATLSVSAPGASIGFYSVKVTGTIGGLSNSTYVMVQVTGPGFSVVAQPDKLSVPANRWATSTISVTSLGGFSGNVLLVGTAPSLLVSFSQQTLVVPAGSFATTVMNVSTTSLTTLGETSVLVVGTTTSGESNFTSVMVVVGPHFSIAASPDTISLTKASGPATSTIRFESLNGFADTVDLSIDCSPDGLVALIPPRVDLLTFGRNVAILTVSAGPYTRPGDYSVIIRGVGTSAGLVTNETSVTVSVAGADFGLTADSTTLTLSVGGTTSGTITVSSILGFTGTIDLTTQVFSSHVLPATGIAATVTPTSVTLTAGSSKASTLTLAGSAVGKYYVAVTGTTNVVVQHGILIVVIVNSVSTPPDFTVTSDPTSLTVQAGNAGTATITVAPSGGFSGTVGLTATVSPSGPTVSLSGSSIAYASGASTLTVNVGSDVAARTYAVTIRGTSGGLSHLNQILVTVIAASHPAAATNSQILGLDPATFYALTGGIAIAVVAGTLTVVLKRRKPTNPPS